MTTMTIPELRDSDKERFWVKIKQGRKNDCWKWIAGTDECGYGKFRLFRRSYIAHRLVYFLTFGPIPKELCVCHTCDCPPCCNPAHLWLGDFKDNMADKCRKGRARSARGEQHYKAILTREDVYEIRKLLKEKIPLKIIASAFGVTAQAVDSIERGHSWKHLK